MNTGPLSAPANQSNKPSPRCACAPTAAEAATHATPPEAWSTNYARLSNSSPSRYPGKTSARVIRGAGRCPLRNQTAGGSGWHSVGRPGRAKAVSGDSRAARSRRFMNGPDEGLALQKFAATQKRPRGHGFRQLPSHRTTTGLKSQEISPRTVTIPTRGFRRPKPSRYRQAGR